MLPYNADDVGILNGIKKVNGHYEIKAKMIGDNVEELIGKKKTMRFDVQNVCFSLAEMAQSIENGEKVPENIQIEIPLFQACDGSVKNRGRGRFAYIYGEE